MWRSRLVPRALRRRSSLRTSSRRSAFPTTTRMLRSGSASAASRPPRRSTSRSRRPRRPCAGCGSSRPSFRRPLRVRRPARKRPPLSFSHGDLMLADLVRTLPAYAELVARLRAGERPIVAGGAGALPGLLLAALSADLAAPLAIVVADEKASESLSEDLTAAGLTGIFHAPAPSLTPYQRIPPSLKARRDEFGLLAALRTPGAVRAAILPARSLFARLPSPQDFAALLLAVAEGDEISLPRFIARLTTVGYRRSDLVTETGDLAVRGGLFDVFSPDRELPVRVELDGDRVASIRVFDPDTQRSKERLSSVVLPPFATSRESDQERAMLTERLGRFP